MKTVLINISQLISGTKSYLRIQISITVSSAYSLWSTKGLYTMWKFSKHSPYSHLFRRALYVNTSSLFSKTSKTYSLLKLVNMFFKLENRLLFQKQFSTRLLGFVNLFLYAYTFRIMNSGAERTCILGK